MDYAQIERPADGLQIINDVTIQPGVDTIEGKLGPLLWGDGFQTYFMEIPGGTYLDEHPHPFEALIYVVRGRFGICCRGKRQIVEAGGLVSFAAHVPMGCEIPFSEAALIVVFRGQKPDMDQVSFVERFEPETPPSLFDLPEDHPAREFARTVNPGFV